MQNHMCVIFVEMALEILLWNTGGRCHWACACMRISIISSCGWKLLLSAFSLMSFKVRAHTHTYTYIHIHRQTYTRLRTLSQTFRPTLNHSPKIKDTLLACEREREGGREEQQWFPPSSSFTSSLALHWGDLTAQPALACKYRTTCAATLRLTLTLTTAKLSVSGKFTGGFCHCRVIDSVSVCIFDFKGKSLWQRFDHQGV